MVPGSTLMYGSSLTIATLSPRASRIAPSEAEAIPLPSEDTTPPVTNTKRVMVECGNSRRMRSPPENFGGTTTGEQVNTSGRAEVDCLTDQSAALQRGLARSPGPGVAESDSRSASRSTTAPGQLTRGRASERAASTGPAISSSRLAGGGRYPAAVIQ